MKIVFIYLESSKEEWVQKALEVYTKKIQRFGDFEIIKIKAPALKRDSKDAKLKSESKLILDRIHSNDYVILFDERGKEFNSLEYSAKLQKIINQSPKRIVFIIGGAFGVSQEVASRAQLILSLSKLVFNHHVAIVVALEQIYRSFTIQKGLPYHNP